MIDSLLAPFSVYKQLGMDGENHIRVGKLNLVDLAGSERQAKTGAAVSHFYFFIRASMHVYKKACTFEVLG